MRAKRRKRRWLLCSGLPEDAVTGGARITLTGRHAVLIEGQSGVIKMSGECVCLKSKSGMITIRGSGLLLRELSLDAAIVMAEEMESVSYGV